MLSVLAWLFIQWRDDIRLTTYRRHQHFKLIKLGNSFLSALTGPFIFTNITCKVKKSHHSERSLELSR